MIRTLIAALLTTLALCSHAALPSTPAGQVLGAGWRPSTPPTPTRLRAFDARHRRTPEPIVAGLLEFRAETGGFALLRVERSEPRALTVLLQERDSDTVARLELRIDDADPPKIDALSIAPGAAPARTGAAAPDAGRRAGGARPTRRRSSPRPTASPAPCWSCAHDRTLLHRHWGLADREAGAPIDADTQFRIGSMNKMFTAVAVLQLVEAGKLALDDPIGRHLTDYPNRDAAARVTVRHLLTHSGGTGDFFGPEFDATARARCATSPTTWRCSARARSRSNRARASSTRTSATSLLGALIEAVTGQRYDEVVQRACFGPAGMTATGAEPETAKLPQRANGYMRRGEQAWVSNADTLPWRGTPAGGGYSTAGDLLRFAQALEGGRLLSQGDARRGHARPARRLRLRLRRARRGRAAPLRPRRRCAGHERRSAHLSRRSASCWSRSATSTRRPRRGSSTSTRCACRRHDERDAAADNCI